MSMKDIEKLAAKCDWRTPDGTPIKQDPFFKALKKAFAEKPDEHEA